MNATQACRDRRVFVRSHFALPEHADLAPGSADQLQEIENALDHLCTAGVSVLEQALGCRLDVHDHALPQTTGFFSRYYPLRSEGFASCTKSMEEWEVLRWAWPRLRQSLDQRDGAGFRDALIDIAKRAGGGEGLRRQDVRTCPDAAGRVVVFPHWRTIPDRLDALFRLLVMETPYPSGLNAGIALVCISHCHPFTDGNGRISRIIFNTIMQSKYERPVFYLPIFELSALSRGMFIMSVRSAELHGGWDDLFSTLARMTAYWRTRVGRGTDDQSKAGDGAFAHVR